jgi:hypothetical protein
VVGSNTEEVRQYPLIVMKSSCQQRMPAIVSDQQPEEVTLARQNDP